MSNNRKLKLWELERVDKETYALQKKIPVTVVLDDIRSLNNIGSLFRTCDSFNVEKVILCGITACPPHKDIHKTALGSTDTVQWEYRTDIVELAKELKSQGHYLCTVEQAEKTVLLQDFNIKTGLSYVIFFGNEVNGVHQGVVDLSSTILEIPQYGTKHSLNVSVCAGVVLWEFNKTLQKFL